MTLFARATVAATVALATLVTLVGCSSTTTPYDAAMPESVTYSQSQAVPDFDSAEYTQTNTAQLTSLVDLFSTYGIHPSSYQAPDTGGCAGGVTTNVRLDYGSSHTDMTIDGCGADAGTFEGDATALFTSWHDAASSIN